MKKKLAMCLSIALVGIMAISGTLAYLTSEDSDVNVMTLGNVEIEQIEQERDAEGNLVDFTQTKPAYPAVGPTKWAEETININEEEYKVFTDELKNVVDKIVTVKNTGESDAYVRTIIAMEAPEGDPNDLIHVNVNGDVPHTGWTPVKINGVEYVYSVFTYEEALESEASSAPSLMQVFLDSAATNEDVAKFGDTWEILVLSQACQTEGFDEAVTALNTAFGEANDTNVITWFEEMRKPVVPTTPDEFQDALNNGEDVVLPDDVEVPADESNAYGKTAITIHKGQYIDGGNHVLEAIGANGTWDTAINATGGTVKNLTVAKGFRGLFINHNADADKCGEVVLENVTIDGCTYTISCDQGTNNGLTATDCTFNGWTSYAATLGDVKFVDCIFGEGNGYKFCRPYAPTEFVGCVFEADYEIDARAAVTFENCILVNEPLTAENLGSLVTSNIANATVK